MAAEEGRRASLDTLQIRLLHLLPEDSFRNGLNNSAQSIPALTRMEGQDPVCCLMTSTFLTSAPPYKALSYTWGDPKIRKVILIDGRQVLVTVNLEAALRQLQKDLVETLTLWVDAVCIDQDNDSEKTEQVQHMRDIYSRAESVITWIGQAGQDGCSDVAMRWIQKFGEHARKLGIGETRGKQLGRLLADADVKANVGGDDISQFLEALKFELDKEANSEYDNLIMALQNVLTRDYWSRIWIVQEVAVASKITFVCGSQQVTEHALHHALRLLRNFRLWQLLRIGQESNKLGLAREDSGTRARVIQTDPSRPIDLLKIRRAAGPSTMMYLLRRLHQFQSTDPRDRIFALIGIATDAQELGLRVSYKKSTEQVYTELARVLVRSGSFDILSHRTQSGKTALRVLSWVPDWSAKTRCAPFQQRAVDRSAKPAVRTLLQPEFSAGHGQTQRDDLSPDDGEHWERPLRVSAISVGDVQELSEPWRADGVGAWLESLQVLSRSSLSVLAESVDRTVAVWRTAAADQDMRQHTTKPRLSGETIGKLEQAFGHANLGSLDAQALMKEDFGSYSEQVNSVARGRRAFLTSLGDLAIGPEEAQLGDRIIVILRADVPFLVRRRYSGAGYHLIGEVYVHGYMDGEALKQSTSHEIVELH